MEMKNNYLKIIGISSLVSALIFLLVLQYHQDWYYRIPNFCEEKRADITPAVQGREITQALPILPEATEGSQKLVILSYPRSGSTLTGDILRQDPRVFYEFEPQWYMSGMTAGKHSNKTTLLDGTPIEFPTNNLQALNIEMYHILDAFLECRFEDVPVAFLQEWTSLRSPSMKQLFLCLGLETEPAFIELSRVKKCAMDIRARCLEKPVRLAKIVRTSMDKLHTLLTSDPNVKVINLFRDPRGSIRSRYLAQDFKWSELPEFAESVCSKMLADYEMSKVVHAHFPGRILTVRYEDIVASPGEAFRQLFQFAGLEFTPAIESYVWSSTYASDTDDDDCNVCTRRSNATETSNMWRGYRKYFKHVKTEQSVCGEIMAALGYRSLASAEEMLAVRVQTTLPEYGEDGMAKVNVREPKKTLG